jgi:hypothetical protein
VSRQIGRIDTIHTGGKTLVTKAFGPRWLAKNLGFAPTQFVKDGESLKIIAIYDSL